MKWNGNEFRKCDSCFGNMLNCVNSSIKVSFLNETQYLELDKLCNERLSKPLEDGQQIIFCIWLFWTEYLDLGNMEDFSIIYTIVWCYRMLKIDFEWSFSVCTSLNITKYCRKQEVNYEILKNLLILWSYKN